MNIWRFKLFLPLLLCLCLLTSCGGSSGSSAIEDLQEAFSVITQDLSTNFYKDTFTVSVEENSNGSNVYVIDGKQKKDINLLAGSTEIYTYEFKYPGAHPMKFSETNDGKHNNGTEFVNGVSTQTETIFENGVAIEVYSITLAVINSTPSVLYYYCDTHSGMGGKICINQTESEISLSDCSD